MSGKIKFNIAEAQNISLELKIAAGRYTQETEELLKVLKNNSLCDKDQDVVEQRGRIEKNNQRLIEYEKFVNTNLAKSNSVIEELFMSVEVLYAQQVSEFRNPNSAGYKELMGNVKIYDGDKITLSEEQFGFLKPNHAIPFKITIPDTENITPEMTVQDYDFEWEITNSKMKE
ncbi:hypothetical protein HCJ78_10010 [Listeria innocua]|nr:hypothetical protein [Listeria innocua]